MALLAAGPATAWAEWSRWQGCVRGWWEPACIAAQEPSAAYLAPLSGWTGAANGALWQGLALLLVAHALNVLLRGQVRDGVRWSVVAMAGLAGLMTLVSGATGQGHDANIVPQVLWILVAPLLCLVIFVMASYSPPHPARLWAMWLVVVVAATSRLMQLIMSAPAHHDTTPWHGMIQAVPLCAYGAAVALAALFRPRGA